MMNTVREGSDLGELKNQALKVNKILREVFSSAGIDLVDPPFGRGAVPVFDDPLHRAALAANDSPVAARIGKLGGY